MKIEKSKFFLILIILLTSSMGYLSLDMYLPSLPSITKVFSISPGQAQLTITVFLIGFCCSQLLYGPLSDRYGRRPIFLIGFSIYLTATLICISTNSIACLLVGRLFQGIGAGVGAVLSRAILRDSFSGNKLAQITSYLNTGVLLITTLSPAIGGYIQELSNYKGNFIAMLLVGLIIWSLLMFLPETNLCKDKISGFFQRTIASYLFVLSQKAFMCNVMCAGIALSILITYSVSNPFLMQTMLDLTPSAYGIFALVISFCVVVGSLLNGHIVSKIGITRMLLYGLVLMFLMGAIITVCGKYYYPTLLSILLPTMGIGISIGIILPNASAGAFSIFNAGIGVAGATYGFLQLLITACSSSIIVGMHINNQFGIGIFIMVLSCIGLLFFKLIVTHSKLKAHYVT